MKTTKRILTIIIYLCSLFHFENGFYVPGVAPVEFAHGDIIDVRVSIFYFDGF